MAALVWPVTWEVAQVIAEVYWFLEAHFFLQQQVEEAEGLSGVKSGVSLLGARSMAGREEDDLLHWVGEEEKGRYFARKGQDAYCH